MSRAIFNLVCAPTTSSSSEGAEEPADNTSRSPDDDSTIASVMSGSSGSAERPADHSAGSNAQRPASPTSDMQSTRAFPDSEAEKNRKLDIHRIFELSIIQANIGRIFRKPYWKPLEHASAEDFATSMRSSVGSAAQPPLNNTVPRVAFAQLPSDSLLPIVRFVGAHNLEIVWECSECNPYWYNWYCHHCEKINRYPHWSRTKHWGYCGKLCGCCRTAQKGSGCGVCEGLRMVKGTNRKMRDVVKTYWGR